MKSLISLLWPEACRTTANSRFTAEDAIWMLLFYGHEAARPQAAAKDAGNDTPDNSVNDTANELLSKKYVTQLCTTLFRMGKNISQLEQKESSRQSRSLARNHRKIKETLEAQGVTYKDITGEGFNSGRKDIEVIAADDSSEVTQAVIKNCESPVIMVNGQIIQKAKGTVLRPVNR